MNKSLTRALSSESGVLDQVCGESLLEYIFVGCVQINALFDELEDFFGLYGQVTKRTRWMPWQSEAMKDVVICEKSWGADKQALIQECPNGETHLS